MPQQRLDALRYLLRLGHPSQPDLALGELTARRADDLDAAREEQLEVRLGGGVLPHARVHRGSDEDRPGVGERRLGEHVVGETVRETGHRVRGQRGDHEQLGALQVRVRILGLAVRARA